MSSLNIFKVVTTSAMIIGFSQFGETLECFKCSVFSKNDPSECQYVDNDTKVETCKENEKYCSAYGLNHVQDDGTTKYSNIRGCDSDAYVCLRAFYAYGSNIRNCQVCETDKCNLGPLISLFENSTSTVSAGIEPSGGGGEAEQDGVSDGTPNDDNPAGGPPS